MSSKPKFGIDKRFLLELQDVIQKVNVQLEERKVNIPGEGTVGELDFIHKELTELSEKIKSGNIPPEPRPGISSSKIVTGAWKPSDKLGTQICALDIKWKGLQ